jgi:hypothetical protein
LQLLSGIYWVLAAKRLGIKKIRGWYTDQGFIYGDDFLVGADQLIPMG